MDKTRANLRVWRLLVITVAAVIAVGALTVRLQQSLFWRAHHAGFGTDLHGVALAGANLAGAMLVGVDLAGANLRGADLEGARLVGADLGRADLTQPVPAPRLPTC